MAERQSPNGDSGNNGASAAALDDLGYELVERYERTGNPADLDRATAAREQALAKVPPQDPNRPAYLNNLGDSLRIAYELHGERALLERALAAFAEAVDNTPPGSPDRAMFVDNLGLALRDRYAADGHLEDLEQAIALHEEAVASSDPADENRLLYLNNLAGAHHERYRAAGDPRDLERAIALYQQAVDQTPDHSPDRPMRLTNLGLALRARHDRTGDPDDLNRAIQVSEAAVAASPHGSPDRSRQLSGLGSGLVTRYECDGNVDDLEAAIEAFREAVRLTPPDALGAPARHHNLGNGLLARYERMGRREDLDEAIRALEWAVARTPADSPARATYLSGLGGGLAERYARSGDRGDLDRAIALFAEALERSPADAEALAGRLGNLGGAFAERYHDRGDLENLSRAIDHLRRATQAGQVGSTEAPGRGKYLHDLGLCLRDRYMAAGDPEDLRQAIVAFEEAVACTPPQARELSRYLHTLGTALRDRYTADGAPGDLDGALRVHQRALERTPRGAPIWPSLRADLGNDLLDRYERSGDLQDLDQAVEAFQEAVAGTPPGAPALAARRNDLGNCLRVRYFHSRGREDLERAIEAFQAALAETQVGSPDRPVYLDNLGSGLTDRYAANGDPADLDRAIEAYTEAVAGLAVGARDRLRCRSNLGGAIWARYEGTSEVGDLDRAIEIFQDVVDRSPPEAPDLALRLNNLARGLRSRYERTSSPDDLRSAISAYRRSCGLGARTDAVWGLLTARNWAVWASTRQSWPEVVEASSFAVAAVERLFRGQLTRQHKEAWLRPAREVAARAAYAYAKLRQVNSAVVTIESGRALLLSEALELERADLGRLGERGRHDLIERYRRAVDRLNAPATNREADLVRAARAELDQVINEIRRVPGYERFLEAATFDDVAMEAAFTPLVYLMAVEDGGLGLVVRDHDVRSVWLPELTDHAVRAQVDAYRQALEREADPAGFSAALDRLTRWLWDALMGRVLEALGPDSSATLVPAGLLGLLPLHAAWVDDHGAPSGRRYALDLAPLTYAPNARALRQARMFAEGLPSDSLLAVEEPRPVYGPRLGSAVHEAAAACAVFAPRCQRLRHEQATLQAVTEVLNDASVLHLACHGYADLTVPLNSGLALAGDEPLTLRRLFELRLRARLTVLSACETALPGTELPDEVIGLPTGLLQAGVAGVVASMWAVPDATTMLLMIGFYDRWRRQGMPPAEALRQAQRWLRDSTNGEKRERFQALLQGGEGTWLPRATAEACLEAVVLEDPEGRAFADPTGWAAFTYTGA